MNLSQFDSLFWILVIFQFLKIHRSSPPPRKGWDFWIFFICRWVGVPIEYSYHVPWIWVNLIVSFEFGHFSDFENSPPPWSWRGGSEKKIRGAGGPREYIKKYCPNQLIFSPKILIKYYFLLYTPPCDAPGAPTYNYNTNFFMSHLIVYNLRNPNLPKSAYWYFH